MEKYRIICNVRGLCWGFAVIFTTEQIFGEDVLPFHIRSFEELALPPFKLNFAHDFKFLEQLGQFHALSALNWWINSYWMPVTYILGQGTEGKVSKCSSKFSGFTCAVKVVPSDLMIRTKHSEPRFFICLALFCIIQFVVEVEWLLTFYYMHHMQWCYADGKAKPS